MALKIKLKKPDQKKTEKNYNSADAISEKSKFAIVESYKSARSNIMFSLSAEDQKVFAVTSYAKGEGKSTVSTVGLSNIIGKMADFEDAVKHDVLPNLDILPSGTIPPNPSELLCSPGFEKLVKGLIDEYDYIIFDTPPIGVVADALLLKDRVAGYVVVLRERSTTHGDIQKMLESIKLADTKILGFIKVGCTQNKKSAGRGYYYYQYY